MQRKARIAIATGIAVAALAGAGGAVLASTSGHDTDTHISGDTLARATAAALTHTGQGRVTGIEVGDEESLYEVEVTLDDGSQVDVQLDAAFHVVSASGDIEVAEDRDAEDNDD